MLGKEQRTKREQLIEMNEFVEREQSTRARADESPRVSRGP
jgi:hypothetical protein